MKHLALLILLVGCATNSGVVAVGPNSFLVAREAATGAGNPVRLKVEAIKEAETHCAKSGKVPQIISSSENGGPYVLGNYPRAEFIFSCVSP